MLTTFSSESSPQQQASSSDCYSMYDNSSCSANLEGNEGLAFKRARLGPGPETNNTTTNTLPLLPGCLALRGSPPKAMSDGSKPNKKPLSQWYLQCIDEDILAVKRLVERRRMPFRGLAVAQQYTNGDPNSTNAISDLPTVDCSEALSSSASSSTSLPLVSDTDVSTPLETLQLFSTPGCNGLVGGSYPRRSQSPGECKHGRWSSEEHLVFLEGLRDHGRDWTTITNLIPTRTNKQVRSHAQKYFQDLDRRLQDHQGTATAAAQPKAETDYSPPEDDCSEQAKAQQAMQELLQSITAAQGSGSENVDPNLRYETRPGPAVVSRLENKDAVESVPARAGESLKAMMGPASGVESAQVCSSNLELAALAAVAANLTSRQGLQDMNARVAAAPFSQGFDLAAIAAAASAISSAPPVGARSSTPCNSQQTQSALSLQAARSIGLLTGGDVLAMDSHLTFVDNMRSILHHFLSALPPASAAHEEVLACLKDVETHLHECRAWAPIMTQKLHCKGQELYERTSMLFDKYMASNTSASLKGTGLDNTQCAASGQQQPCHQTDQFSGLAGEIGFPLLTTGMSNWPQTPVVPVMSESPDSL
ncbi:hypothetical protein FOL47_010783 [Perkinsus chesapeaki]|uniref:Uncharacterized protein n=1 Tax=Perkinsus chesapeaki TaxID=330153 RepID=A0A7J6MPD2_PERCH|nr:hypothetical protein FOL47_010783 [Perkinsus chesapeaki]